MNPLRKKLKDYSGNLSLIILIVFGVSFSYIKFPITWEDSGWIDWIWYFGNALGGLLLAIGYWLSRKPGLISNSLVWFYAAHLIDQFNTPLSATYYELIGFLMIIVAELTLYFENKSL